ncbi:MAG TPA: hypothetical protein VMF55_05175 [Solirubrobacterales bacterium]|nr:hypothetical protein [Solirubrobacterales bacterium]
MERTKKLRLSLVLGGLALLTAALLSGGIAGAAPLAAAELEFAGDTAELAAGQVAVPVECVGGPSGFCSGTLAIHAQGKKSVSTFSVQSGGRETIFVPLAGEPTGPRAKVTAVARTDQPLGPAITRRTILHLH